MPQAEGLPVPPHTSQAQPCTSAAENAAEFPWRGITATDIHAAVKEWYSQRQAEISKISGYSTSRPPPVLIVANPLPPTHRYHLPAVQAEAMGIQDAYGGNTKAELLLNTSVQNLDGQLFGREVWYFAGHGDAVLERQKVPAFVKNDQPETLSIDALVHLVQPHARHGQLKLVVFTGCCTYDLAKALHEQAGACAHRNLFHTEAQETAT